MGGPRGRAATAVRSGGAVAGGNTTERATHDVVGAGNTGGVATRPAGPAALWQKKQSKQSGD